LLFENAYDINAYKSDISKALVHRIIMDFNYKYCTMYYRFL